jgi:hypothetical protein
LAPTLVRLAVVGLALSWPSPALAQTQQAHESSTKETPGLRATQVTLVIDQKDGKGRRFRATVMARKDNSLTVLTAAHCLSADDTDGPVSLLLDGEVIKGTVASVVRNPAYKPNPTREIPGADNAVARFHFKPASTTATEAYESLKPAIGLTSRPYPGPSGQTVNVRIIDQHGVEHAVKAGNYSNPRLLEWGLSYKPLPGDSGSGVFVMSRGGESQQPRPILIGIISSNDDKGGMASLISKEMRWIADELVR